MKIAEKIMVACHVSMFLGLMVVLLVSCGTNDGNELEAEKRRNFTAEIVTVNIEVDREERAVLDYDVDAMETIRSTEEDVSVILTGKFTEPTIDLVRFNWAFVIHVVPEGEELSCEDGDAIIVTDGADMDVEMDDLEEGRYDVAACVLDLNKGDYHEPLFYSFEI